MLLLSSIFLVFSSPLSVQSQDTEHPIFYAIEPVKGGGIDVFARVFENCGLWRSTADEYFLYRGDANGYWFIEDIENPETNKGTCSVYPQKEGKFRLKFPKSYSLPQEDGWVNTNKIGNNELATTIIFFELKINEMDSSYAGGYPKYSLLGGQSKEAASPEDCIKRAKQLVTSKDDYLFVSSTMTDFQSYNCKYVRFSFARFDSVILEEMKDSVLNVFRNTNEDGDEGCNIAIDSPVRKINIFNDLKSENLPPFYLIEPEKNKGINMFTRASMNCAIYKSTTNDDYLYKEEYTGFWYIEDFEDAILDTECCSIQSNMMDFLHRLEYPYDYTLPGEDGWKNGNYDAKFTFFKFEPCEMREGFKLFFETSWPKDNITECIEYAKKSTGLDFVFVSVTNKTESNKVECQSIGISSFSYIKKISVNASSNSVLYLLDKNCQFEDKIDQSSNQNKDDITEEDENSSSTIYIIIGGAVGGLVLLILFISIIFFICKKKETVKVDKNDLYGNMSEYADHKERYQTNIIDSNQYYEHYDNEEFN